MKNPKRDAGWYLRDPRTRKVDDTVCSLQTLGILGIHVQRMENRGTLARLLSHILPFLPVAHWKACGCCRARRGSRRQTRKEVNQQSVISACLLRL